MPVRTLPWLAGLLVLGAGVRAVYLVTPDLDSDMAIVGLMGRHILAGEFPIFFWGYSVIPVMTAAFLVRLRRATPPIFAVALAGLLLAHVAGAVATAEVFDPRKLERYRRERARDRELIELLAADRLTRKRLHVDGGAATTVRLELTRLRVAPGQS